MKVKNITQSIAILSLAMAISGCGGGGSSSNTNTGANQSAQNPIEERIIQDELNPSIEASIDATAKAIEETLEAAAFSSINGQKSSAVGVESVSVDDYHLADVIFTLGTDDLRNVEANKLEVNAAYNYFKTYVADAGKLSDKDAEAFSRMTIEEYNEAFVAGYYQAAAPAVIAETSSNYSEAALLSVIPKYTTDITNRLYNTRGPLRFSFFSFFNPFTYINFIVNIAKTVMTAILAQAFKVMLLSGTMTKFMLRLALRFPILTNVMISVLSSYWGITRRMIPYLKYDTEFGELFMQLAYEQPNMAHFVFQNIDAPLYYGMSVAMTRSQETTERLATMMNWYSSIYFVNPATAEPRFSNFVRLLLNTGAEIDMDGETNHGDGNELANEKLYYSLFKSSYATGQFIDAMKQVEPQMLGALMDHIFLGQQRSPVDGSLVIDDSIQGTYNIYAIAQGMLDGMASEGFGPYISKLMAFAFIIPEDRYIPYAQVFAMAGYSYYAQSLPEGSPQPTMEDFMQFLMGTISQQLGQVDPAYGQDAQAFGQMLQSLQPYIDEFMQNGMGNIVNAPINNGVPDVTAIDGSINDPITDPLEQDVQNKPYPTSLIDIIYRFPVLWEKDYSNDAYKGQALSRYNTNKVWEGMSTQLSNLKWMHIPSTALFTPSSTFDFIFEEGTVDMYIISNDLSVNWNHNEFSLTNTGETVSVKDTVFNSLDTFNPYKVYKVTIPAGTILGNLNTLIQHVDGIAFDINGTRPIIEVNTTEPTEPPTLPDTNITEPVDENNTVIIPEEPPVIDVPQVINLTSVINLSSLSFMSESDYSEGNYVNGLVNAPWWPGETWTSMPTWLSNLKWIDIDQDAYISSSHSLDFIFDSGSVDMYLVTTHSNLPWLLDMNGLSNISITPSITSTEGQQFYVFKASIAAGSSIEKLWLMINNISGLAFDTENVTLAP
jgi:hypothetical protein